MPTIIATPSGTTSNSYVTLAEADDIATNRRLNTATWLAYTQAKRETSLLYACNILEQSFDWNGVRRDYEQRLNWPRSGIHNRDGIYVDQDTIPEFLKEAQVDLAIALTARDRVNDPALFGYGFIEAKAGPLDVKLDKSMVLDLIPRHVLLALEPYGSMVAPSSGMREVRLGRV